MVWATRKFRCYLDRNEFDLYTDHKALKRVFNETNHTSNAKLARWAMELSQLRFKVFHKPGTSMGHVDGLSRLHAETVCALTISDLLNDDVGPSEEGLVEVGEGPASTPEVTSPPFRAAEGSGVLEDAVQVALRALGEVGGPLAPEAPGVASDRADIEGAVADEPALDEPSADNELPSDETTSSPVESFGLGRDRFVEEQRRTPWGQAMIAFLDCEAFALDAQLWSKVLLMAVCAVGHQ
jgi:hypothetical protein